MLSSGQLSTDSAIEPVLLLVWHGDRLARRILSGGGAALEQDARTIRSVSPPGTRVLVAVVAMPEALLALGADRRGPAVGLGGAGEGKGHARGMLTMGEVEDAIAGWYVQHGVEARLLDGADQLGAWVGALTRAVGEQPYRTKPTALAAVHKVRATGLQDLLGEGGALLPGEEGGGGEEEDAEDEEEGGGAGGRKGGAPPAKKGRFGGGKGAAAQAASRAAARRKRQDPRAVFFCQLQMIPGLSASKAVNVVKKYPSMVALMEAYDRVAPLPAVPPFVHAGEEHGPAGTGASSGAAASSSSASAASSGPAGQNGKHKKGRRRKQQSPLEAGLAARRDLLSSVLSAGKRR